MSTRPPHHYEGLNKKFHQTKSPLYQSIQLPSGRWKYKESHHMAASTDTQKAFFKSLADFARSTANVLDEMAGEVAAAAAPAKPTKAKEKPAETAKVETAKVETAKVETAKVETKPANGGDLMAQCRSAAKSYAEVYGREGLKEQIQKFTTGTLADVPAEKLPELLKVLG